MTFLGQVQGIAGHHLEHPWTTDQLSKLSTTLVPRGGCLAYYLIISLVLFLPRSGDSICLVRGALTTARPQLTLQEGAPHHL